MKREPFIAHSELTNEIYIVAGKEKYRVTEQAIKAVMAIEALKQEPKTGHWIDDKCSVCGKGIEDLIASPEWYSDEEPNFCPFCGIKIEPQESELENPFNDSRFGG